MSLKGTIRHHLNKLISPLGFELAKISGAGERHTMPHEMEPVYNRCPLPVDAETILSKTHPRLLELKKRYADFNEPVTDPLIWTDDYVRPEDLLFFRGDNAYVWQVRDANMDAAAYALTTYYLHSIDDLGLFKTLVEDEQFGIHTFEVAGKVVSRDLLDSIAEIYFLEKHLNISRKSNLRVVDIGAGYGRLAYRMAASLETLDRYICTDAFPDSTHICDYYLRFRNVEGKAMSAPLDEIEETLAKNDVQLAINIHSFSECKPAAIDWWISLLAKNGVSHLMIVPNTGDSLKTNDGFEFLPVVEKHGYELAVKEPKYRDPIVQAHAVNPTFHYLFQLKTKV